MRSSSEGLLASHGRRLPPCSFEAASPVGRGAHRASRR